MNQSIGQIEGSEDHQIRINHRETFTIFTKFPCNSYQDISVQTKDANLLVVLEEKSGEH